MPVVSEDVPQGDGANSSLNYGQATEFQAQQREMQSRTGTSSQQPQPGQQQPMPQPGGPPPQAAQAPPPPQDQGRLNMDNVFPPMPEMGEQRQPWRQQMRAWSSLPFNSAHQRLDDLLKEQKGPMG